MVLSLDGVPFDFLLEQTRSGMMPNLAELIKSCPSQKMRSAHPTVSSVAWSNYMTGRNPGKHGIFGFVERRPESYEIYFPNSSNMSGPHIWEILSHAKKRVIGLNIPVTYPPRPINGILVGGFLAPGLEKAVYPLECLEFLRQMNYRIDIDTQLARQDKTAMLRDLHTVLDSRIKTTLALLRNEEWDFFHVHIMGTDRINHFFWHDKDNPDSPYHPSFYEFYRELDLQLAQILDELPQDTALMLLSDHGFCPIRYEVMLSRFLVETGWTTPGTPVVQPLSIIPEQSRAYCLIPGRIYLNVQGREPHGIVAPSDYDSTLEQLSKDLTALTDPDTGQPVIDRIYRGEELFSRAHLDVPQPPDLLVCPHNGYDLKMGLTAPQTFVRTELQGMHTYDDAFLMTRGFNPESDNLEIKNLAKLILKFFNITPPQQLDER